MYVDHSPLTYLPSKPHLNRWQVRILETLVTYPGLTINHIPGKTNIADGLSRIQIKLAEAAKGATQVLQEPLQLPRPAAKDTRASQHHTTTYAEATEVVFNFFSLQHTTVQRAHALTSGPTTASADTTLHAAHCGNHCRTTHATATNHG